MNLPYLESPRDYVGLFAYDIGNRVSIGYTADEIGMLRRHPSLGGGQAYLVHAVDEDGRIALRGATERDLFAEEAMLFGHDTSSAATASYERFTAAAKDHPLACPVRIELARDDGNECPHVVALVYRTHASPVVSAWLLATDFAGGESVRCGADALAAYRGAVSEPVASGYLTCLMRYTSRDDTAVLECVDQSVQR